MTESEKAFMKEYIAKNLISLMVEKYNYPIDTAFDILYNSETFLKLSDDRTGLYFQSPNYVFTYLDNEITTGKLM
ncbi:MAG: hypothetical protein IIU03_09170 [Bacteroidales bacterium]|nr:hypothetical protein [Bacteroidales bacterium]MBQ5540390.1 hypothetical protein [Bacteroidales bacterium]MEE3447724.1 hypothetical protein [Bacteroidales bacterium]